MCIKSDFNTGIILFCIPGGWFGRVCHLVPTYFCQIFASFDMEAVRDRPKPFNHANESLRNGESSSLRRLRVTFNYQLINCTQSRSFMDRQSHSAKQGLCTGVSPRVFLKQTLHYFSAKELPLGYRPHGLKGGPRVSVTSPTFW